MLEKLKDGQLVAVNLVSFIYSHTNPMQVVEDSLMPCGTVNIKLCVDSAGLLSHRIYMPSFPCIMRKLNGHALITDISVPVSRLKGHADLDSIQGRSTFIFSLLQILAKELWWTELNLEEIQKSANYKKDLRKCLIENMKKDCSHKQFIDKLFLPLIVDSVSSCRSIH